MRTVLVLIPILLVVGCATPQRSDYVQVPDRKYNTLRLVKQDGGVSNAFIGTSATQPRATPPRQHP